MPAPITIKIGRDRADRRINTRWHGEFLACHSPGGNDTVRGHWDVTFIPAGLRVCELKVSLKKAIEFCRTWDASFATLSAENPEAWDRLPEFREAFQATVAPSTIASLARKRTKQMLDDEFGVGQSTAVMLARTANLRIVRAKGTRGIMWRRQFCPLPTDADLDRFTFDSVCETPKGAIVEPDNPESWLRLLRLV